MKMNDDDALGRMRAFEPAAIMRALGFLSRIPVSARFFGDEHRPASADAGAYPIAGIIVALPGAVLLVAVAASGASALLAASIAVLATVALTGALHEDGLADTADGFGGGASPERRLAIMKDSTVGAYGVIAVAGALLLRAAALAGLAEAVSPTMAALAFVAAHALARAAMVWHWSHLPKARPDGVAAAAGQPAAGAVKAALLGAAAAFVLALLPAAGLFAGAVAAVLAAGTALAFARLCRRMVGGHTGDTIGASEQVGETVILIGLAMAV